MSDNILDTDSEDEIPPGWEERVTFEGRVFYARCVFDLSKFLHANNFYKYSD
jgi:WW domain-containing oxidoreductase